MLSFSRKPYIFLWVAHFVLFVVIDLFLSAIQRCSTEVTQWRAWDLETIVFYLQVSTGGHPRGWLRWCKLIQTRSSRYSDRTTPSLLLARVLKTDLLNSRELRSS